ncbi:MAG: FtsQ-type POTRA domain-containing protein [Cyanobacteria bacterium P01_D01_bin.73]
MTKRATVRRRSTRSGTTTRAAGQTNQVNSVSRERLAQRRSQLRRQRQTQSVWGGWQSFAAIALLAGTGWLISAPIWVVRSPNQIEIEGNVHLDDARIRQLLGLTYPQSLWRLEPEAIANSLKARAPIDDVTVTRQLLPPGLIVRVQELQPVAVVQLTSPQVENNLAGAESAGTVGLVDQNGKWIEISRYQQGGQSGRSLPKLKVIASNDQLRQQWPALYRQINLAPVRISTIQWQDADNLILETELGRFHLGAFGPNFSRQLEKIASLRNLAEQVAPKTLDFIDLRDPNAPLIQTK